MGGEPGVPYPYVRLPALSATNPTCAPCCTVSTTNSESFSRMPSYWRRGLETVRVGRGPTRSWPVRLMPSVQHETFVLVSPFAGASLLPDLSLHAREHPAYQD